MQSIEKKITDYDVNMFAKITGDYNKLHTDNEYAKKTIFENRVAHGMLTASLVSTVLGTKLPGEGCILLSIYSKFIKPVYIDDIIKAVVRVKDINYEKNKILFDTFCINQKDIIVMTGEAWVSYKLK